MAKYIGFVGFSCAIWPNISVLRAETARNASNVRLGLRESCKTRPSGHEIMQKRNIWPGTDAQAGKTGNVGQVWISKPAKPSFWPSVLANARIAEFTNTKLDGNST